jgi:hypothetical protein
VLHGLCTCYGPFLAHVSGRQRPAVLALRTCVVAFCIHVCCIVLFGATLLPVKVHASGGGGAPTDRVSRLLVAVVGQGCTAESVFLVS